MVLKVFSDKISLGKAAAEQAATAIRHAIRDQGRARVIAATAASQLEFLNALTKAPDIDWQQVVVFHLDEYIGLPITHPGSFRKMLLEQLIQKTGMYHLLDGDADAAEVVRRTGAALVSAPVDIAFVGIGEKLWIREIRDSRLSSTMSRRGLCGHPAYSPANSDSEFDPQGHLPFAAR